MESLIREIDIPLDLFGDIPPIAWRDDPPPLTLDQQEYWCFLRSFYGAIHRSLEDWFGGGKLADPQLIQQEAAIDEEDLIRLRNYYLSLYALIYDGWREIKPHLGDDSPGTPGACLLEIVKQDCWVDWVECRGYYKFSPRNSRDLIRLGIKEKLLTQREKDQSVKLQKATRRPAIASLKIVIIKICERLANPKRNHRIRDRLKEFKSAQGEIEATILRDFHPGKKPPQYQWNRGQLKVTGL